MAYRQLDSRTRAVGAAAALAANGLLVALLLSLSHAPRPSRPAAALAAFDLSPPPPPSPPAPAAKHERKPAAAAPRPRDPGRAAPHLPLQSPTPAATVATGAGAAAEGAGSAGGGGTGGSGASSGGGGGGAITPPVHVAGSLSDADYRQAGLPRGAGGTVVISFRVRRDGAVDQCQPVRSSGNSVIDAVTCRLVEQRFRFRPALDPSGQPIDFVLRTDFTWRPR